jgi:hypothetical protein
MLWSLRAPVQEIYPQDVSRVFYFQVGLTIGRTMRYKENDGMIALMLLPEEAVPFLFATSEEGTSQEHQASMRKDVRIFQ